MANPYWTNKAGKYLRKWVRDRHFSYAPAQEGMLPPYFIIENALTEALENAEAEGRYQAVKECAQVVERYLAAYPAEIFPGAEPGQHGNSVDACSAAALRAVLPNLLADIQALLPK